MFASNLHVFQTLLSFLFLFLLLHNKIIYMKKLSKTFGEDFRIVYLLLLNLPQNVIKLIIF